MRRSFSILSPFISVLLLFALAGKAPAAQITFLSLSGNWHDPTDNVPGTQTGDPAITNGVPTSSVTWGVGNPQSAYDFTRNIPGTVTLPPAPTPFFPLGTFTHRNFPINEPSLTSVKLDVVLLLKVDSVVTAPLTFTFTFNHEETPNNQSPCPYPTPAGEGCTDRVTFVSSPQPTTFNVGGTDYTLAMSFVDDQNNPVSEFITRENMVNTANLRGQFTLPPPPPSCGDNICNGLDTCSNCPQDCGVCPPPPSAPNIVFSAGSYSASETAGFASIKVLRQGADLSGTSTVQFATADGTAKSGVNYLGVGGTLTFYATDTSKTFEVPIINDGLADGNKTVLLTLANPTGATLGTPSQATLTITDAGAPNPPPPAAPFISELVPYSAPVTFGSPFTLRVLGSGFDASSAQVFWNSTSLSVVSRSAGEIDAIVDPNNQWGGATGTPGPYPIKVRNPSPADSNQVIFTVMPVGEGNPPPYILSGPTADPNPTTFNYTTLNVQGASANCLDGSCLTYTWRLAGANPSTNVTFDSHNGQLSGTRVQATFPVSGVYHFQVSVMDTVTKFFVISPTLDVTVNQKAASLKLSADKTIITPDQTVKLTVAVKDQFGKDWTNPTIVWGNDAGSLAPGSAPSNVLTVDAKVPKVHITATLSTDSHLTGSVDIVVIFGSGGVGTLDQVRLGPVPFKSTSGQPGVKFTGLPPGARIRIFSTDGRLIQTLTPEASGEKLWDLTNSGGNRAASGVYLYIIDYAGQKKEGKLVLIL